jgi:hypothetical protein
VLQPVLAFGLFAQFRPEMKTIFATIVITYAFVAACTAPWLWHHQSVAIAL